MTQELQIALERQLNEAMAKGDANLVARAQANILFSLMDCQRKTADRVKELHASREKVAWLIRAVQGFAAAGGFAAMVKLMKVWGML